MHPSLFRITCRLYSLNSISSPIRSIDLGAALLDEYMCVLSGWVSPYKMYLILQPQILFTADRFDFILHANQTVGTYYIVVQTLSSFCRDIKQIGSLQYVGSRKPPLSATPPNLDFGVVRKTYFL